MKRAVILYLATLIVLVPLDFLFLGVLAKEFFKAQVGPVLGDINIAEPKALIGFAGPRVIEQTIRQKLPEGFQRAEYLLDHGMVDIIVERKDMKQKLATILGILYRQTA